MNRLLKKVFSPETEMVPSYSYRFNFPFWQMVFYSKIFSGVSLIRFFLTIVKKQ